MSQLKIKVDRKAEAGFRRRALAAFPLEYMEVMWGAKRGDVITVTDFFPFPHRGTKTSIYYDAQDMLAAIAEADGCGMMLLGSIHTHPHRKETIYSEDDFRDILESTDLIMGICSVQAKWIGKRYVKSASITYWPAPRPLPMTYLEECQLPV